MSGAGGGGGPGKWLLSQWGTGCQGRKETSPILLFVLGIFHWLLEIHLPPSLCPSGLACLVSITGFLLSDFWLGWTFETRIDWDRNEDRVFISWLSPSRSLELAVSLQKIMASLKGWQLYSRNGSLRSSTYSLPSFPTGLTLTSLHYSFLTSMLL